MNCRPRKIRKKYNRRLIRKRIEKNRIDILVKRFENDDKTQTIVVNKISFGAKVAELLLDTMFKLFKVLFWIAVCILITIGMNTLLNSQLREQVITMFRNLMGG